LAHSPRQNLSSPTPLAIAPCSDLFLWIISSGCGLHHQFFPKANKNPIIDLGIYSRAETGLLIALIDGDDLALSMMAIRELKHRPFAI